MSSFLTSVKLKFNVLNTLGKQGTEKNTFPILTHLRSILDQTYTCSSIGSIDLLRAVILVLSLTGHKARPK